MKLQSPLFRTRSSRLVMATLVILLYCLTSAAQQSAKRAIKAGNVGEWPENSKRWALLIGVDQYSDDTHFQQLRAAVNDAKALKEALVKYAGFPENQVILLTSDQPERLKPTRNNILREMGILGSNIPRDGLLWFSFSGHGLERGGQVFLAPSDTQAIVLEETALSASLVMDMIKTAGVTQVMLLLDACRNNPVGRGAGANRLTETYARKFDFAERNKGVNAFATLYATGLGQVSLENPATGMGYFSEAVVEGLKGAAASDKGEITLQALISYVEDIVPKRTRRTGGEEQKPFENVYGYKARELVIAVAGTKPTGDPTASNPDVSSILKTDPAEMSEVVFWNSISSSRNPEKFEAYLEQYPRGRYAKLARITLSELKKGQSDSLKPPDTLQGDVSRQQIELQTETAYWNSIVASANPEAFREYLRQYPNGRYASMARERARDRAKETATTPNPVIPTTNLPAPAVAKRAGQFADAGNKLAKEGQWARAEAEYRQAVQLEPGSAVWRTLTAVSLTMQKRDAEAEVELRMAAQLAPQNPQTHSNLGRALEKQSKVLEAEAEYRAALKLDVRTAQRHGDLGFILLLEQRWTEAEAAYREALRLEPAGAQWHTGVGAALLAQQRIDQAEIAYRKAIELEPRNAQWHADLAFLLSRKQGWDEAQREYREAIRLDPQNLSYQERLKQMLAETVPASSKAAAHAPDPDATPPVLLNMPAPRYTEIARNKKVQGKVTARVLVGEDGIVKGFEIISGLPYGLNEQAEIAARNMRFKPAVKNGRPVEMWIAIEIGFSLR